MSDFHLANKPTTTTTSTTTPATTTKASETPPVTPTEKASGEPPKSIPDENPDDEEIADDLSEISDEADEILGQQEVRILILDSVFLLK